MIKPARTSAIGAWAAAYVTLLLALMWSRHLQAPYLIGALALWGLSCMLLVRARPSRLVSLPLVSAVAFLAILLASQTFAAWRIARIGTDWPELVSARRANLTAMLDREIGRVVERGQRAATLAAQNATVTDTTAVFRDIAALQQRFKVDALAVFGEAGGLIAWAGEHRAKLPDPVRRGIKRALFVEQPLYSYVYFPASIEDGSTHVVAAVLLGTAVHEHAHDLSSDAAAHVMSHVGASFRAGSGPEDSWPLVVGADTVAHARLAPVVQSEWRADAVELAQRVTVLIAALVLVLLGIAWLRWPSRRLGTMVPLLAATAAIVIAPLRAFGLEQLFSPALFLLPLPADISLGTLFGVLIMLGALAASLKATARVPRLPTLLLALGAVAIAVGYPGAIRLLVGPSAGIASDQVRAAGAQLLLGGPALWFGLQIAAVLLLGIITELALPRWTWSSPLQATARPRSPWVLMLIGALATSGALSVVLLLVGETRQSLSPWIAAAWALPFLLAAFAISAFHGRGVRLIRWVTAGWLATTAVLPYMWIAHVDARLESAERALATLGSNPDPYLEFLLRQFSHEIGTRARSGETGYLLLYRSWVSSGLARESYPARLTIWSGAGVPEVQLPLGKLEETGAERRLSVPRYLEAPFVRVSESSDSTELMQIQAVSHVNQVLIRAIDSAHVVTVEVPPRRTLGQRDVPFLAPNTQEDTRVELVPARIGLLPLSKWVASENGWRSETLVRYVEGEYHAHMEVRVPRVGVRIARGVLLLFLNLALFTLLWLVGRAARGEHLALRSAWRGWRGSFRARVTATLFFFFLIPTAAFGWVAFGALAREVTRATRIVAERAVRQAVVEFEEAGGDLAELASHTGSDVLYYFHGELDAASSPEARDLGVYGAWMPAGIYQSLTRADEDAAVGTRKIAGQDVLTAYRALQPAGTLAVPMSLESGDTAVRQGELAHLMLFAALIGGLLSLLLSVIVGRALTGPIGRLQRAAAQVGSGNLRVRLPEQTGDEFGQLYASFNRMVRRLRRARTQEIRTARVLAWGEMARQVAHEIKNPLTPIKLAVQHLKRAYSDGKTDFSAALNQSVEQILLEIDRLSEIARAFSRYGAPETSTGPLEPVNVPMVIHEALTLYRAGDPDVEYRDEIELDVPRALGRSGELKEVLLNLLENARAAVAEQGGRIVVTARRNHDGIELAVSDNGPGIPSDFLPRVFDPHFSTRSAGTGLGLAIVRRLVESWGGRVVAESQLGAGTTIRVTLLEAP